MLSHGVLDLLAISKMLMSTAPIHMMSTREEGDTCSHLLLASLFVGNVFRLDATRLCLHTLLLY